LELFELGTCCPESGLGGLVEVVGLQAGSKGKVVADGTSAQHVDNACLSKLAIVEPCCIVIMSFLVNSNGVLGHMAAIRICEVALSTRDAPMQKRWMAACACGYTLFAGRQKETLGVLRSIKA
jgi:hypothetical protein